MKKTLILGLALLLAGCACHNGCCKNPLRNGTCGCRTARCQQKNETAEIPLVKETPKPATPMTPIMYEGKVDLPKPTPVIHNETKVVGCDEAANVSEAPKVQTAVVPVVQEVEVPAAQTVEVPVVQEEVVPVAAFSCAQVGTCKTQEPVVLKPRVTEVVGEKKRPCCDDDAMLLGDENALRSRAEIGKEIKKNKKNIFGYQKVDKVDSDETCILFIGGNGTLTDKAAHGYLKSAIALLKQHHLSKNVTVYGTTYDFGDYFNTKQALAAQMKKYGHKPLHRAEDLENMHADTENPQFIKQIFDKFILPRISTLDGKVKIPATEAAKKMNKLKIVAHCFGGYATLKLEEMSLQKMSELGYTQKEQATIQGQLQILAMNPYCPLGVQKSEMFSVISAQDREVTHNNYFEKYIRKMVSKGKTVPLSYFKKDLGNFVLVNRMYGSDNRVVTQTDDGEHSYFGFSILPAHSEKGKIAMTFAQNYLINGIKSALKDEVRQKDIAQLVAQNKVDTINFAKAGENGRILYNEIATQTLAENDAIFKKKVLTNKKE